MNIFVLDEDPVIAAQRICDKHLVKMPLESTQLWSAIARHAGILDGYDLTHGNHPCCIWLKLSNANRLWFYKYTEALFDEFEYRRDKTHASRPIFERVAKKVLDKKDNWFIPTLIKKPDEFALRWYEKLETEGIIELFRYKNPYPLDIKYNVSECGFVPWYQAMPLECRDSNPIQGYINYYKIYKKDIVSWNWVPARGEWYDL